MMRHPIDVSENGRFLQNPDGSPFFWLGDTAWQLFHRLDAGAAELYFADRAAQGYTVVQAVATGKIYQDADYGDWRFAANANGDAPFPDGDILHPDEDYFRHVDELIRIASRHGVRIALLPIWSASAAVATNPILHAGNARAYGEWIASRYRDAGVIWVLGGDINAIWGREVMTTPGEDGSVELVDYRGVYDELAAGILSVVPDAFLTYHPTPVTPPGAPSPRTSAYFADRDWLAMNMIESGHSHFDDVDEIGGAIIAEGAFRGGYMLSSTSNHLTIAAEYASVPARPVVDGEPHYEAHPKVQVGGGDGVVRAWSAHEVRAAAYHALFAGAAGHTYGHVSIWDLHVAADGVTNPYMSSDFPRPDWTEALHAEGGTQMRHAAALLLSRPYYSRIPDDAIVLSERGAATDHVSGTRDADGGYAMVYLPRGGSVTVATDRLAGATARAWWFDPRTGVATPGETGIPVGSATEQVAPSAGADQDWVLVLDAEARGFAAPGA